MSVAGVLAIDVGTSSVRAQVFDGCGHELGQRAARAYPGETDPDRIVELTAATVEAAAGHDVEAAGASCFGHSLLALDASGRPLTPVLGWSDTRSADAADRLARRLDPA